nr:MAG TPA: hypothetical protein [Inoviridae sp.]
MIYKFNNFLNKPFNKIILWFFLGFIISLVGIIRPKADTLEGWAKNVDLFTDVNLGSCSNGSCSFGYSLTDEYFYDTQSLIKYGYFTSENHSLGTYGDMILNFHRYKSGYLYSHSTYLCFSNNITIDTIETYVGNYSSVLNKVGNLDYNEFLVQTLDNNPFSPGDEFYKCNLIVNLFVPSVDGQNIGTVFMGSTGSTRVSLIGEKYESLGIYTDSVANSLSSVISSSGLATASSINQVNSSINQVKQEVTEINNSVDKVNDTLNDDDTTGATSEASDFFSGFNSNTFGLTSIVTAPLNLIQSLTSQSCSSLHLPLPYLDNKYLDLPCMSSIYSQFFGNFFTLYQTITFGIVAYWVCVRIFNQVKDFKNPEHDEIEVLDL